MSAGKCKVKQQCDTTIYLPQIQNTDNTNAAEDVKQEELSFTADGVQGGTATVEDSLVISFKTKHSSIM